MGQGAAKLSGEWLWVSENQLRSRIRFLKEKWIEVGWKLNKYMYKYKNKYVLPHPLVLDL